MNIEVVTGDLLQQDVDVIVNSWNRNIIPWWLLILQGVAAAIKKQAGNEPFKEVARYGSIPLGEARITSAGNLPFKAIIHVAGINLFWMASEYSVRQSVINVMKIVNQQGYKSVAMPLIGSGAGTRGKQWSEKIILDTLASIDSNARGVLVRFSK